MVDDTPVVDEVAAVVVVELMDPLPVGPSVGSQSSVPVLIEVEDATCAVGPLEVGGVVDEPPPGVEDIDEAVPEVLELELEPVDDPEVDETPGGAVVDD